MKDNITILSEDILKKDNTLRLTQWVWTNSDGKVTAKYVCWSHIENREEDT